MNAWLEPEREWSGSAEACVVNSSSQYSQQMRYRFGDCELDDERRVLLLGRHPVDVGQIPFDLIVYLVENSHRVVAKDELRAKVWGGRALRPSTIPTAINAARRALGDSGRQPRLIQTIYGRGYRVIVPVRAESDDLALGGQGVRTHGFLGRGAELAQLQRVLEGPPSTPARLVLISGEPGIGKTSLLEELCRVATSRGHQVAVGLCSEVQGAPAFWPWRRVLEEAGGGDLWRSLWSLRLQNRESEENAGAVRFELFDQVARVLTRGSDCRLLVAIDDVHCADIPSLRLLEFVAAQARPRGVHIVCAHRLSIDGARGEALRRIRLASRAEDMKLEGLSDADTRGLIAVQARFPVNDEIVSLLVGRSRGNPFFLRQIVSQLNVAITRCGQQDLLEEAQRIGPGLRWAVEARLSELNRRVVEVLGACSVLGREFDVGMVGRVVGLSEETVLELLEEPLRLEIIEEDVSSGVFQFGHVFYQEVLYSGLSPRSRVAIHPAALEALEHAHGDLKEDAACAASRHCLALPVSNDPRSSIRLLGEAAAWSEANLGFEEAVSYLRGALRVLERAGLGDPSVRCDLLVRLSGALRRSGDRKGAEEACKRATALAQVSGNAEAYCGAVLAYAPGFFALEVGVVDEYLIDSLEEARRLAGRCSFELRSKIAGRLAMALYWSDDDLARRSHGDEAVLLAEASGNAAARAVAVTAREVSRWGPGGSSDRAALALWAIKHARLAGDREMELVCRLYRLTSLLQLGRFDEAWREVELFSRKAAASLHGGALWYRELFVALRAMISGEWEVAESSAEKMRGLGDRVQDRNAENCSVIHDVYREIECGSDARALCLIEAQAQRFPRVRSYHCGRVFLSAATGDSAKARRLLRGVITGSGLLLPKTIEWITSAALLAEACVRLRDKPAAHTLFKELRDYENEFVVVVFSVAVWRPVSYFLGRLAGLLGDYEESERLFEKARQLSNVVGANPWLADIDFAHAEILRRRAWPGDGKRARELALLADTRAQQLGMKPLLARIRGFLWGERGGSVHA